MRDAQNGGTQIGTGTDNYGLEGSDWVAYAARQVGTQGLWIGATDAGAGYAMASRAEKLRNATFGGTKATAQALGNLSDKAPLFATRLASGSNMAKLASFGRVAGPIGTTIGLGFSANNLLSGQGSGWDWADLVVGATALVVGGAGLIGVTIALPVVLAVGIGAGVYFSGRLAYDLIYE